MFRTTLGRRVWTIRCGAVSAGGFRHRVLSRFVIAEDIGASPLRDHIQDARARIVDSRYALQYILCSLRRVERTMRG